MDSLALARWQFGITTVYHYLFVPVTIGMALFIAIIETAWVRTRKVQYLRAAKFWGKLFLINFAVGVVTGIVQEFQFGMNWSDYSRFVGDVFGAPLAMEALLAFFLESTFIGLWIFGWDKLSPRLHVTCMWVVAAGTSASAYFILAANSFMQHPVGYTIDPVTKQARMTDIGAVLFQKLQLYTFGHVILACVLTGAVLITAVSAWFLMRRRNEDVFRPSLRLGLVGMLIGAIAVLISGDLQAKVMTDVQPMKMAAAEALYQTSQPASFSLITVGTLDGQHEVWSVRVPDLLSFMATGSFDGKVEGINNVQAEYTQLYGPGDYRPNVPLTYWMFRLMVGAGFALLVVAIVGLWLTRKGRLPTSRWVWRLAMLAVVGPYIGNSAGWVFTEMGRQPWTVVGLFKTADSVSPNVSAGEVLTSLIIFTVLYGVMAAIEARLFLRYTKAGPISADEALESITRRGPDDHDDDVDQGERVLTFAY
ncbi:cytochrome d ubiquinol oxidase subunit I [Nakamurella panacisegetis]|uniref:Cytochrome d ubiquinol oxidase subunit I n=1 Tax=Nakamurella panacisegetis TaxID=1090615 RepID=A0A1H0QGV9_9ACTN|nr:cytochrome ubiquinol oxidase subunit I [Nakamurella panacisegetis]SDP15888.1 cytochrome d ubiquinol oxidase subunit I [Nakamurella panacisegetis]